MNESTNFLDTFLEKSKYILAQISVIILYVFLVISLRSMFIQGITSTNKSIETAAYILIELIILIIYIAIFRKTLVPDWDDFKKNFRKYIKDNYKYWVYGLLVMIISNTIINEFLDIPINEELNRNMIDKLPIYSLISITICAPLIEEAMTRIFFRKAINNKYVYMITSGLIFGSLHLLSITSLIEVLYVIPYSALGCAFAYIYYNSNNIYTNIFFHALHNTIAIILIFGGM